jgi:hypothetical protein
LGQAYYDKYHTEITKPSTPATPTSSFKAGDLVTLSNDAVYYTGKTIPSWVKAKAWYVKKDQVKDRVVIGKSEDGAHDINSPINEKYLTLKEAREEEFIPYRVKVTASLLNYRQGPSTSHKINGTVKKGEVFTIVAENGDWGKLKSGAGWIHLGYTKKI